MSYVYEHAVPFKYKKYTELKAVTFTDEIKTHLDDFYQYIDSICEDEYKDRKGKVDKEKLRTLIAELAFKYKELRNQYIKPVVETEYKYKELLYTQEEVDFIFACSYPLLDKFNMSQSMLCEIFFGKQRERKFNPDTKKEEWKRTKENKFSKLGCFPVRCHDAYTKLDDVSSRKSLIPNDSNSVGIQIAECINKKVQTHYLCSAFVGVSNDLDVFTNISSTDKKAYVLTRPSSDENFMKSLLSYPRFLFASANNFENAVGNYQAGEIRKEIIRLLLLKDDEPEEKKAKEKGKKSHILKYSKYLAEVLEADDKYRKYCKGSPSTVFKNNLLRYREQRKLMSIIEDDDYYAEDIIYNFEYRKTVGINADDIDFDLYEVDLLYEYLENKSQECCASLLEFMSYAGEKGFDETLFTDYQYCMMKELEEKSKLFFQNERQHSVSVSESEKIRLAAIYWVLEVCGGEPMTEQKRDNILKWLKSKNLLSYFDAIHKEVNKGRGLHLFYESEDFDINSVLDRVVVKDVEDSPPVLLYIDSDSYKLRKGYADSFVKEKNIILVVRATEGFTEECGMKLLDEQLNLYIKERHYGNI